MAPAYDSAWRSAALCVSSPLRCFSRAGRRRGLTTITPAPERRARPATSYQKEFTGSLVSVEFEDDDGLWIYKVKLLTPAGAIVKLEYDARDGRLLRIKGRGAEAARRQKPD